MHTECRKRRNWKVALVLLIMTVVPLLTACWCGFRFWEPLAPERTFTPEDLLIDQDIVPPGWELSNPFFPTGDTLCTTECASRGFKVTIADEYSIRYGGHDVYRYRSTGIARRTFEIVYLSETTLHTSASGWTYQSPVADRWHFGCNEMAGSVGVYCEWGGQYEEYIVLFGAALPPGEVSLANIKQIEDIVRAIDARMAEYLSRAP